MVPDASGRIPRVPPYSVSLLALTPPLRVRVLRPLWSALPGASPGDPSSASLQVLLPRPWPVWARPFSLAATCGFSFDFSSCGYLDVSVPRVSPRRGYVFAARWKALGLPGFPIRIPPDHRLLTAPRRISLFAASFIAFVCPWHPPYALSFLTLFFLSMSLSFLLSLFVKILFLFCFSFLSFAHNKI